MEGLGWYTYEVFSRMARQHPEDEFVFLFDRPYDQSFIFSENVTAKMVLPPARHPLLFKIWYEYSLPLILDRIRPDVFISPDNFCSISYSGKTILVVHDLAYRHFPEYIPKGVLKYYRNNMPRYVHRADRIVAISEATKADIVDLSGELIADKITVIPNGVRQSIMPLDIEEKRRGRQRFSGGKDYFLFVGAIHPRKNIQRLVQAFNAFKQETNDSICLVLCGRMAWHTDEIKEEIDASPYKKDIILTGHLPEDELNLLLGSAFTLVYPSLFEGFGLPIVEAFNAGVPVITSNQSSMPEVAGDAALLIDPYSVEELAISLKYIRNNTNLARNLIKKGYERRSMFNWDLSSKHFYQTIKLLLKT